jgi:hypothetical protein
MEVKTSKPIGWVRKVISALTGFRIPWILPRLYIKILIVGLVLVGLNYSYLQNLTYCSDIFGGNFCSPIGIYIIAFTSIPGYLVVNAILPKIAADNDTLYSFIVFVTSLLIYSLLGYSFAKKKEIRSRTNGIIMLTFLILLFVVLFLVSVIRG